MPTGSRRRRTVRRSPRQLETLLSSESGGSLRHQFGPLRHGGPEVARLGLVRLPESIERLLPQLNGLGAQFLGVIRFCEAEAVSYTHLRAHETRHDLVC